MKLDVGLEVMIALGVLSERDREITVDKVITGRSLEAIAADQGMSRAGCALIVRRSLEKMRALLEARDVDPADAA